MGLTSSLYIYLNSARFDDTILCKISEFRYLGITREMRPSLQEVLVSIGEYSENRYRVPLVSNLNLEKDFSQSKEISQ